MRYLCLALILLMPGSAALAESGLDRLFHTPEQRALLDAVRRNTPMHTTPDAHAEHPGSISVSGMVTRSDGRRSTWINGRMEHEKNAGRTQKSPAQLKVTLPEGEVKLKVGQSIDPATGQVTEAYRRAPVPPTKPQAPASPVKPTSKPATPESHVSEDEPQPR